jgi:hypothetical protein
LIPNKSQPDKPQRAVLPAAFVTGSDIGDHNAASNRRSRKGCARHRAVPLLAALPALCAVLASGQRIGLAAPHLRQHAAASEWSSGPCGAFSVVTALSGASQTYQAFQANNNSFGFSVALSSSTAVMGDQGYNDNTGCVHVFQLAGGSWQQVATLHAGDELSGTNFGESVAISGSTIVVGAPGDEHRQGRVYVFQRQGSAWGQTAELQVKDIGLPGEHVNGREDQFGEGVAVSGGTIVASNFLLGSFTSAPGEPLPGVNTYVFQKRQSGWEQVAAFPAGGNSCDVAISGDFIAEADCQVPGVKLYVDTKAGWKPGPVLTTTNYRDVSMSGPTLMASSLGNNGRSQAVIYVRGASGWVLSAEWPSTANRRRLRFSATAASSRSGAQRLSVALLSWSVTPVPVGR